MPRGFKRDWNSTVTVARLEFPVLRKSWLPLPFEFSDPRSFISLPKSIQGECISPRPHLVVYGTDKAPIRAEIFRRDREKNHSKYNHCWKCGVIVFEIVNGDGAQGEWDHIRNKPGERCDCPENGRVACRTCHKEEHPQVQFGKLVQK